MIEDKSFQEVPVAIIVPGHNDRKLFNHEALVELAESIAEHGLAQPITVRPVVQCEQCKAIQYPQPDACNHCACESFNHIMEVVAGERRFRAISQILEKDTAPCIIREMSNEEAAAIMLAENTDRVDLNCIEEAEAYQSRVQRFGWDLAYISKAAGVSVEQVRRRLSLLDLVPELRHLIMHDQFPLVHAEAMTKLDPDRQRIAIKAFNATETSPDIVMFRRMCSKLYNDQQQDSLIDLDDFYVQQIVKKASSPRNGKDADVSHLPQREGLPAIIFNRKDTVAIVVERWMVGLTKEGFDIEAQTVGTLYAKLVEARLVKLPFDTALIDC